MLQSEGVIWRLTDKSGHELKTQGQDGVWIDRRRRAAHTDSKLPDSPFPSQSFVGYSCSYFESDQIAVVDFF